MKADFCGGCYEEKAVSKARCHEKPEAKANMAIGMYHCPDCGTMVLAGFEHPPLCENCQTDGAPTRN